MEQQIINGRIIKFIFKLRKCTKQGKLLNFAIYLKKYFWCTKFGKIRTSYSRILKKTRNQTSWFLMVLIPRTTPLTCQCHRKKFVELFLGKKLPKLEKVVNNSRFGNVYSDYTALQVKTRKSILMSARYLIQSFEYSLYLHFYRMRLKAGLLMSEMQDYYNMLASMYISI